MCPKCRSCVLVEESTTDPENGREVYLIRCPICGWYNDATMEANRRNPVNNPKDRNPQQQSQRYNYE